MRIIEGYVSVVVPVYNEEEYLGKCLDSILEQTYSKLEIIVIDDGSTDRSGQICDCYGMKDSRIQVLHTDNGGLSAARNMALEMARGEYLFFCDSDDYLEKNALELLVNAIKQSTADMVLANYRRIDDEKRVVEETALPYVKNGGVLSYATFWEGAYHYLSYVVVWSKLYRRVIWDDIRFPVGMIHEDQAVLHLVYDKCNQIVGVDKVIYNYRVNREGIMNQGFRPANLDMCEHMLRRMEYFLGKNDNHYAMITFGVGSRVLLKAYKELDRNDEGVKSKLHKYYSDYCKYAWQMRHKGLGIRTNLRLRLFCKNIHLYAIVREVLLKDECE